MKLLYYINEQRLILEMEHNAKQKAKGVLNWYKSVENIGVCINILYDVYGVTYYYKEIEDKVPVVIKMYLDARSRIDFPVNAVELLPRNEIEEIKTT
jgi:hypothetical protein